MRGAAVDYKQVLSAPDFAAFASLCELRKQLAQAESVPVFAVFTNEPQAAVVTQRCTSLAALGAIDGIGPARLDKYGAAVLACLQARLPAPAPGAPAA